MDNHLLQSEVKSGGPKDLTLILQFQDIHITLEMIHIISLAKGTTCIYCCDRPTLHLRLSYLNI